MIKITPPRVSNPIRKRCTLVDAPALADMRGAPYTKGMIKCLSIFLSVRETEETYSVNKTRQKNIKHLYFLKQSSLQVPVLAHSDPYLEPFTWCNDS